MRSKDRYDAIAQVARRVSVMVRRIRELMLQPRDPNWVVKAKEEVIPTFKEICVFCFASLSIVAKTFI